MADVRLKGYPLDPRRLDRLHEHDDDVKVYRETYQGCQKRCRGVRLAIASRSHTSRDTAPSWNDLVFFVAGDIEDSLGDSVKLVDERIHTRERLDLLSKRQTAGSGYIALSESTRHGLFECAAASLEYSELEMNGFDRSRLGASTVKYVVVVAVGWGGCVRSAQVLACLWILKAYLAAIVSGNWLVLTRPVVQTSKPMLPIRFTDDPGLTPRSSVDCVRHCLTDLQGTRRSVRRLVVRED
ncbi:hypothetical protein AB1N83_003642 [Pleurotus pulmonarius]